MGLTNTLREYVSMSCKFFFHDGTDVVKVTSGKDSHHRYEDDVGLWENDGSEFYDQISTDNGGKAA